MTPLNCYPYVRACPSHSRPLSSKLAPNPFTHRHLGNTTSYSLLGIHWGVFLSANACSPIWRFSPSQSASHSADIWLSAYARSTEPCSWLRRMAELDNAGQKGGREGGGREHGTDERCMRGEKER